MISPGVCLTYDDLYVENWLAARTILNAYKARVTFCVCKIHSATQAQIDGLRTLQDDGHEIGYHGRNHRKLKPYLQKLGLETWLENEVTRGVAEHRALGFPATSYAAPFYGSTAESRAATAGTFLITRAGSSRDLRPRRMPHRIYTQVPADGAVHSIGSIDYQHSLAGGWGRLHRTLDLLVEHRGVGVFNGHDIRARKSEPGRYSSHAQLERLLRAITDRGLTFYTLSGFARSAADP